MKFGRCTSTVFLSEGRWESNAAKAGGGWKDGRAQVLSKERAASLVAGAFLKMAAARRAASSCLAASRDVHTHTHLKAAMAGYATRNSNNRLVFLCVHVRARDFSLTRMERQPYLLLRTRGGD